MKTKFRVLFAEDDENTKHPITAFLSRHPYIEEIQTVENGLQALNLIKSDKQFDLLITDIRMPMIDGLELIKKAKEINRNLFVIVISAYNHQEYLEVAANSEINAYLVKPINIRDLTSKIDELFNYSSQKSELAKIQMNKSKEDGVMDTMCKISHHWRQPLSIISLEAQMLVLNKRLGKIDDVELIRGLELISSTSHKLSHDIDELYQMTLQSNNSSNKATIDIEEFFNNALKDFEKLFELEDINVEINVYDHFDINVDSENLSIVIKDLVLNSIEQINIKEVEDPKIKIDFELNKNNLLIYVEDNAGGIDEEIINKIFEPYFTTKLNLGHLGLGLYFSKNILTKTLNGDIDVSNTDDGVRFTVLVPI